jgi:hypothetical protein
LNDPRRWFVTLSLGNGDEFKTETGRLTREVILGTPLLGAGYYQYVYQGPTYRLLEETVERVYAKVTQGWRLHQAWSMNRTQAKPGVVWTSDKLGGATWPDESIWKQPLSAVSRARTLFNEGQLLEATKFIVLAATLAEWNSLALHKYINATMRGASTAVSVLEVASFMGKIAEGFLLVYSAGAGLIRLLGGKAGSRAAGNAVQRQLTPGKPQQVAPYPPSPSSVAPPRAPTPVTRNPTPAPGGNGAVGRTGTKPGTPYTAPPAKNLAGGRNPDRWGSAANMEDVINKVRVQNGMKPLPNKTNPGTLGRHNDAIVQKAHDEYMKWLAANPGASLEQKIARFDRLQEIRKALGKSLD